jgi:thiol-disulfide isomerase/thioredoxin
MNIAALIARLLLASVFIVAGLAKLADRKGSRQVLVDFRFPTALASPLGILLPLAELTVAVTLLPTATAWWGALGALALLLLFIAGIGLNLARGRKPDCHCFGQLHSGPAGWKTLARNGVLAAVAGFLIWQGWKGDIGPSAVSRAGALSTVQLLGLVGGVLVLGLLVGQWWFLAHLLRQNGRVLVRLEVRLEALEYALAAGGAAPSRNDVPARPAKGLPVGYGGTCGEEVHPNGNGVQQAMPAVKIGEPAPKIEVHDLSGEVVDLWSIKGEETLVLFWDPGCGFCRRMLPYLKQWEKNPPEGAPNLLVVSAGTEEATREMGLDSPVLFDQDFTIGREFGAGGTPSAVLVDAQGKVASEVTVGAPAVLELAGAAKGKR